MTTAKKINLISVDDYLAGELVSPVKHEYWNGVVYAMAGATNVHNLIATNVTVSLGAKLRGKRCRAYNSDTKVRVKLGSQTRFYYPDALVTCRPNAPTESFQDEPVVIVEVLSPSTRRIDNAEKKEAYLQLPSLQVYLLVESNSASVVVYRRTSDGFAGEVYDSLESIIPLPEIEIELPLGEIYETVVFEPEAEEEII